MLIERYPAEEVCARVPARAGQTDPVLVQLDHLLDDDQLDHLLDDDQLDQQVRADLVRRDRLTPVHGRHSPPAEVLLRLLVVQHLYTWSYQETVAWVADSLVLRWFCRVYFRRVPDKTTLLRWAATIQPVTLQALVDRAAFLAKQARVTHARKRRIDSTCVQADAHPPSDRQWRVGRRRARAHLPHPAGQTAGSLLPRQRPRRLSPPGVQRPPCPPTHSPGAATAGR